MSTKSKFIIQTDSKTFIGCNKSYNDGAVFIIKSLNYNLEWVKIMYFFSIHH